MRVFGITGWSGSGKTTLIKRLITALRKEGISVSTIKHAHHSFDVDQPGKDSFEHRKAGAKEVLVSSSNRWALMHEMREEGEPVLIDLIKKLSKTDLILVEGFKNEPYPKLEVYRETLGKRPLWPSDGNIIAVASNSVPANLTTEFVSLEDLDRIVALVLSHALPITKFCEKLQ
ncbi:MAG: molybdopterin-guanine dinucleotide biosynthesis protein B [Rhodospirillaceae bacterium]